MQSNDEYGNPDDFKLPGLMFIIIKGFTLWIISVLTFEKEKHGGLSLNPTHITLILMTSEFQVKLCQSLKLKISYANKYNWIKGSMKIVTTLRPLLKGTTMSFLKDFKNFG